MQESLPELKEQKALQLEFDFTFDGYDAEPVPENSFENAETLTLQAITSNSDFTDLFEDAVCMNKKFCRTEKPDGSKGIYYLFRAHDAVTGRNIAVKVTNPLLYETSPHLEKSLEWESAVLEYLKGKKRIQQIVTPLKTSNIYIKDGTKNFLVPISFFSSIYLGIDVRKSFFDSANDQFKTCANRLNLFCSMITAVQSLHREGFCHRDLKPTNIMGTRDKTGGKCTATLIDLGLCLATEKIERELRLFSQDVEIPQAYAAPELYSGFNDNWALCQSADIYSLGCMLFELLDKRTFYTALTKTNDTTYWEFVNNVRIDKNDFNSNNEKRLELYNQLLTDFASNIIIPRLSEDSPLPDYVRNDLQLIINSLCNFDYRKRAKEEDLNGIKEKIRRIAKILEDAHLRELYKKRKEIHRAKTSGIKEEIHA